MKECLDFFLPEVFFMVRAAFLPVAIVLFSLLSGSPSVYSIGSAGPVPLLC